MITTEGTLLGGRVRYAQPSAGYRTGIEPVLLAASVAAAAGQRVLEAGTGAGAGLLCLAARVPGVFGIGVEIDEGMAALARRNLDDNGFIGLEIVTGAIETVELGTFDHAMANPPWHDHRSTASPVPGRGQAKQEADGTTLEGWMRALAGMLTEAGSLTMVLPAAHGARALAAMAACGVGDPVTLTLAPKAGRAAKLMLVQGWRGRVGPVRAATTVLHEEDGRFTPAIEAVLRHGGALAL